MQAPGWVPEQGEAWAREPASERGQVEEPARVLESEQVWVLGLERAQG